MAESNTIFGSNFYEINNSAKETLVEGSSGNDLIVNSGDKVTIQSKDGDDIIEGSDDYGEVFRFGAGEGNNTIVNFADNDTIHITNGTPSLSTVGNDLIIDITGSGESTTVRLVGAVAKDLQNKDGFLTVANAVNRIPNHDNEVPVDGTAGNDLIINTGDNVTIQPGRGNDTVEPSSFGELFIFGARDGDNLIKNFGANDTVMVGSVGSIVSGAYSADGNDYIITIKRSNDTCRVTLQGAGAFNIDRDNSVVSVRSGREIYSEEPNSMLRGTSGSDYIVVDHRHVTVQSGAGNDTIEGSRLYGDLFQFAPSDGDNIILNFNKDDTIMALGNGVVTSEKFEDHHIVTIRGESSSAIVKLENTGNLVLKSSGGTLVADDANYISITQNTVVTGTADKDYIENISGAVVTIQPNGGNDTVIANDLYGEMFVFAATDGNNLIRHFGKTDTIRVTDSSIQQIKQEGNDYVIYLMKNNITGQIVLEGAGNYNLKQDGQFLTVDTTNYMIVRTPNAKFDGTDGNDRITNNLQGVSIQSGRGDDTIIGSDFGEVFMFSAADGDNVITNFGKNDTIFSSSGSMTYSKSGDDYIVTIRDANNTATILLQNTADYKFNLDGSYLTAEYAETIDNGEDNQTVEGTPRADRIINYGEHATIHGGAGDDTITGSDSFGDLYLFASNENDNVITNFGLNDTLRMTAGNSMTWSIDGDDVLVTLKGALYTGTVRLQNTANYNFVKTSNGKNLYVDSVNTIENHTGSSLVSGTNGRDYIVNSGNNVTINGMGGDDTIEGSNFGETFLVGALNGNDLIRDFGTNDTLRAVSGTIDQILSVGEDAIVVVRQENDSSTITLEGAGDYNLNVSADGTVLNVGGGGGQQITNRNNNTLVIGTSDGDRIINIGENVTINPGAGNDTMTGSNVYGELYLFSSAYGYNTISNFSDNDSIYMTAGQTMTWSTVNSDVIVTLKGANHIGTVTLRDVAGLNFVKSDDGKWLTVDYITTIDNSNSNVLITGNEGKDYIINAGSNVTIDGRGGNDTIEGADLYGEQFNFGSNYGDNVIVNFGDNDTLCMTAGSLMSYGDYGDDVIVTIKGASFNGTVTLKDAAGKNFVIQDNYLTVDYVTTIYSGVDRKLITGTEGRDYIYNSGYGVTINSGAGDDTIEGSNYGEMFLMSSANGNNVILNFGDNDSISMTAGTNMTWASVGDDVIVTLQGKSYTGYETLLGAADLNLVKSSNGKVLVAFPRQVGPTLAPHDTLISGMSGADYINIALGEGNVTVQGNGGDDTLIGSDYGDMYLFGSADGNNLITNFAEDDSIYMTAGKTMTLETVENDVIVTFQGQVYKSTVTLQGAAGMNIVKSSNGKYLVVDDDGGLENSNDNTLFSGTENADYMTNYGSGVSISPGKGNDTIDGSDEYGDMFLISSADGNNVITNFGDNDTLRMTAGRNILYETVGSDVLVTLKGASYTGFETLLGAAGMNFETVKSGTFYNLIVNGGPATLENYSNNVFFGGTADAEYMINNGNHVTINGGGGGDTIEASSYGELFAFSSAYGDNVIIDFGENDSISMTAGQTMSFATIGADVVVTLKGKSYTGTVTLQDAAGLNFAKSSDGKILYVEPEHSAPHDTLVAGTSARELIDVSDGEGNVTIDGRGGGDTIIGSDYGDLYLFSSAYGSNVITNFGDDDTIRMTAGRTMTWSEKGSDVIVTLTGASFKGYVTLQDAAGLNFKSVKQNNLWNLYVDSGVETISNSRNNVKFIGSADGEYMINYGSGVSIDGMGGGDTIYGSDSYGDMYLFSSAYSNNVILNFAENDTIYMTAGNSMTWSTIGSDVEVTLKGKSFTGTVTLQDAAGMNFVKSTDGRYLYVDNGPETLENYSDKVKFVGTSKAEYMFNNGDNVTVDGKGGGDTIEGSNFGELYQFSSAYGDNVIINFDENDSLQMTAGNSMTWSTSGNDVVVTLQGKSYKGTVTLQDAAGLNFAKSSDGKFLYVDNGAPTLTNTADAIKFSGSTNAEYMINGGEHVTIDGKGGGDTIEGSDEYGELYQFSSAYGDNIIINFGDKDSLQMTAGSLMSGAVDGDDYVVTLKGKSYMGTVTLLNAAENNFVIKGNVLTIDNGPATLENYLDGIKFSGSTDGEYIINGGEHVTIDGKGGGDTIEGSDEYGELYQFSSAYGDNIIINFGDKDSLQMTAGSLMSGAVDGDDYVVTLKGKSYMGTVTLLNAAENNFVIKGNVLTIDNGPATLENYLDGIKFSGTSKAEYIFNNGGKVTIESGGGDDTIEGSNFGEMYLFSSADGNNVIIDFGANDSLKMTAGSLMSYAADGSDVIVTLKGASYTGTVKLLDAADLNLVKSSDGKYLYVDSGTATLENYAANMIVNGTAKDEYLYNYARDVTIYAGGGNDTVFNEVGGGVIVDGGAGDDSIFNPDGWYNSLVGGDGNDTILNDYGSYSTIEGGAGNDFVSLHSYEIYTQYNVIKYASGDGNDTVIGLDSDDTIRITDGSSYSTVKSGSDVIVSIGGGSIRLKNYSSTLNIVVSSDQTGGASITNTVHDATVDGTGGADIIYNDSANSAVINALDGADSIRVNDGWYVTANAGAGNDTVWNNSYGSYMYIDLGAGNDYLYGDIDSSTVIGGKGNDTFTDEDGNYNTYLYASGDGNDVFLTFFGEDSLVITDGSISSHYADGNDYVISVVGSGGSGQILLKDTYEIDIGSDVDGNIVVTTYAEEDGDADADSDWEGLSELAPFDGDYWFERATDAIDEIGSMLEEIPLNDEAAIGSLAVNFDPTTLLTPASSAAVKSARHLKK